jgi:hypothetical protein
MTASPECRVAGVQTQLQSRLGRFGRLGALVGGLFPHLLEILLHVRLQRDRNLVAVDLPASLGVMRVALCVLCAQLLIAVFDFDSKLSRDIGGALADDFADLAHGRKLFGQLHVFAAVLPADAAARLLGGGLLPALAGAAGLRILRVLAIVSGLSVFGIGLLPVSRLLALLSILSGIAGLALLLASVLRTGLLLRSLGSTLLPHAIHQTGHGVAEFAEQA